MDEYDNIQREKILLDFFRQLSLSEKYEVIRHAEKLSNRRHIEFIRTNPEVKAK